MSTFLQGRIDLVQQLRSSSLGVTHEDLELILTAVVSACAARRWPGEGFDRKRFVESLIQFGSPSLHLDYVSIGGLLEAGLISESETLWGDLGQSDRIFTGDDIDSALPDMSRRYPHLATCELKKSSYASLIYRLRCGYAHTYSPSGNTTCVPPSRRSAQLSYIGRSQPDGTLIRIASFHLDYLIEVAHEQVCTLPDEPLQRPSEWWIDKL